MIVRTIILFLGILAVSGMTRASIVYTDIPDGQPLGIDFNQDGTMEFNISTLSVVVGNYIEYISTNDNNNIYAIDDVDWDVAKGFLPNKLIDVNGNWNGAGDCSITGWGLSTVFTLNKDRYIGMKFEIDGSIFYGWVCVEVTCNDVGYTVKYKDYAYEDNANTGILTGNRGVTSDSSIEFSDDDFSIFPNPSSEYISINNYSDSEIRDISIYSLAGQVVLHQSLSDLNGKIDIRNLPEGSYLLILTMNNDDTFVKKLIKN